MLRKCRASDVEIDAGLFALLHPQDVDELEEKIPLAQLTTGSADIHRRPRGPRLIVLPRHGLELGAPVLCDLVPTVLIAVLFGLHRSEEVTVTCVKVGLNSAHTYCI